MDHFSAATAPSPIATVRGIYAAVAIGDIDAALSVLCDNIVVEQSSTLPFAGRWVGHEGFIAMGAAIHAAWPDFVVTPKTFFGQGGTVLVLTQLSGGVGTAVPLEQPMIERWCIVDGKAVECQPFYFDPPLAAASANRGT